MGLNTVRDRESSAPSAGTPSDGVRTVSGGTYRPLKVFTRRKVPVLTVPPGPRKNDQWRERMALPAERCDDMSASRRSHIPAKTRQRGGHLSGVWRFCHLKGSFLFFFQSPCLDVIARFYLKMTRGTKTDCLCDESLILLNLKSLIFRDEKPTANHRAVAARLKML